MGATAGHGAVRGWRQASLGMCDKPRPQPPCAVGAPVGTCPTSPGFSCFVSWICSLSGSVGQCSAQVLDPDCLDLCPSAASFWRCDRGRSPLIPVCKRADTRLVSWQYGQEGARSQCLPSMADRVVTSRDQRSRQGLTRGAESRRDGMSAGGYCLGNHTEVGRDSACPRKSAGLCGLRENVCTIGLNRLQSPTLEDLDAAVSPWVVGSHRRSWSRTGE